MPADRVTDLWIFSSARSANKLTNTVRAGNAQFFVTLIGKQKPQKAHQQKAQCFLRSSTTYTSIL